MTRQEHRQVRDQLVDWAESSRPLPSPELARFLGPIRPVPVTSGGRSWGAAVRTGLGLKVMGLIAALAITGAAAVGVAQVALHEPDPSSPVIAPADPSTASASDSAQPSHAGATSSDDSATPTPSEPSTTPSPTSTDGHRPVTAPQPRKHASHEPTPSPSEHHPSPEPTEPSDGPSDPSGESHSPEPSHTADSATPTSEDPAPSSTSG
jgi:hypothetical protein